MIERSSLFYYENVEILIIGYPLLFIVYTLFLHGHVSYSIFFSFVHKSNYFLEIKNLVTRKLPVFEVR